MSLGSLQTPPSLDTPRPGLSLEDLSPERSGTPYLLPRLASCLGPVLPSFNTCSFSKSSLREMLTQDDLDKRRWQRRRH